MTSEILDEWVRTPARSRPGVRRVTSGLAAAAVALAVAACGGAAATSHQSHGSTGPQTTATVEQSASIAAGRKVFETAGCTRCHTLAAVGATGHVGPNLDELKPSAATVEWQVTHGGGGMPSFRSKLSKAQIDAVAEFVSSVAGRHGG